MDLLISPPAGRAATYQIEMAAPLFNRVATYAADHGADTSSVIYSCIAHTLDALLAAGPFTRISPKGATGKSIKVLVRLPPDVWIRVRDAVLARRHVGVSVQAQAHNSVANLIRLCVYTAIMPVTGEEPILALLPHQSRPRSNGHPLGAAEHMVLDLPPQVPAYLDRIPLTLTGAVRLAASEVTWALDNPVDARRASIKPPGADGWKRTSVRVPPDLARALRDHAETIGVPPARLARLCLIRWCLAHAKRTTNLKES